MLLYISEKRDKNFALRNFFHYDIYFSSFFCRVQNWALKIGTGLWQFGSYIAKTNDIKNVSKTCAAIAMRSLSSHPIDTWHHLLQLIDRQ